MPSGEGTSTRQKKEEVGEKRFHEQKPLGIHKVLFFLIIK